MKVQFLGQECDVVFGEYAFKQAGTEKGQPVIQLMCPSGEPTMQFDAHRVHQNGTCPCNAGYAANSVLCERVLERLAKKGLLDKYSNT